MKIIHQESIVRLGDFASSNDLATIENEIALGVETIRWPLGADRFYLDPASIGKKRGQGNGVKPIKLAFIDHLKSLGWKGEADLKALGMGPLDAAKETPFGKFAVEWETGNISSSHRALNKICLGVLKGELIGGVLLLPSIKLYKFLTDRIGNYKEITPYLDLWKNLPYSKGAVSILVVEHDGEMSGVPRIPKGTDGRAMV